MYLFSEKVVLISKYIYFNYSNKNSPLHSDIPIWDQLPKEIQRSEFRQTLIFINTHAVILIC